MHLVQLLLPLYDNEGRAFPREQLRGVRDELTRRFGGVTTYDRTPAAGIVEAGQHIVRDDIVVLEVMVQELSASWWNAYRARLEQAFAQDRIIVRALPTTLL